MNGLNLQQMMAMMQQGQGGSSDAASSLQELCSFKAGRCQASPLGDGSLKITPMKGKGLLKLTRTTSSHSEGEGMIHLSWEDRKTKETPDKFIIFPSEAKFEKIETPYEEDTPVCMLSYNGNSDRRNFYWVQELGEREPGGGSGESRENPSRANFPQNFPLTFLSSCLALQSSTRRT